MLQALRRELETGGRPPTREEAVKFQLGLGALISFTSGGVLRSSSVSGLFLLAGEDDGTTRVAAIRGAGYEGALTMAVYNAEWSIHVLHLLAFKNDKSYASSERVQYVMARPVSDLLAFFMRAVRVHLQPLSTNSFVFVKHTGANAGSWFESSRDGFGRLCGHFGLDLGASIQVIRHIVSTAAVVQDLPADERADIEAANLHTLEVAKRYYVSPLVASAALGSSQPGRLDRGLGKCIFLFRTLTIIVT